MVSIEFFTHSESKIVKLKSLDKFLNFSLKVLKDEEIEINIDKIFESEDEFSSFEPWIDSVLDGMDLLPLGFGYGNNQNEDKSFDLYFTKETDEKCGDIWIHLKTDFEIKNAENKIIWAKYHN